MTDEERWAKQAADNGWTLPAPARWPLRLPLIRHVRALWHKWHVERHYEAWTSVGMLRTGYDDWVLYAIWRGWA